MFVSKEFVVTRQDDLEIILNTELGAICESRDVYQKILFPYPVELHLIQLYGQMDSVWVKWRNNETNVDGSYEVTVTDFWVVLNH